jgi:RNA polymerase sigma-70 factor (ECF subfamily)
MSQSSLLPDSLPSSNEPVQATSSASSHPEAGAPLERSSEVMPETVPPSFDAIYRESHSFVRRKLWWLGIERHDLDDLTQDVFLVVYRRLPSYDPHFAMKAWLGGIAWRVARNHQGRVLRRGEEALPEEGEGAAFASLELSPAQVVAQAERSVRFRGIVQRLAPDLRVIFVMHEMEEIPMSEIAEALEIPLGTAWSRQRRAVALFKAAVQRLDARAPGSFDVAFGLLPGLFALDPPRLDAGARAAEALETQVQVSFAEMTKGDPGMGGSSFPSPSSATPAGVASNAACAGTVVGMTKTKLVAAAAGLFFGGAGAGILADRALSPRLVPVEMARTQVEPSPAPLAAASSPFAPVLSVVTASSGPATPSRNTTMAPPAGAVTTPAAPQETEGMLLRRAKAAVDEGRTMEAIQLLQRHAMRSPNGPNAARREALLINALLAAGRRAEAMLRAERFRAAFPGSAFQPAIDAMLRAP